MVKKVRKEVDADFAKLTYQQFVSSIEIHYGEILKFIAIVIPTITGYAFIATSFVSETTSVEMLFVATLAVIFILSWGIFIAFAMSYRFRYLQYVLSNIENRYGIDTLMPGSFKAQPIKGKTFSRFHKFPPEILLVHIYALAVLIILLIIAFWILSNNWIYIIITTIIGTITLIFIFFCGSTGYTKKYNSFFDVGISQSTTDKK